MNEPFSFAPTTPQGEVFIQRIRVLRPALAELAREYDASGKFARRSFGILRDAGILAAAVPAKLGGMDVQSPHDLAAGAFELAQACSSTAIASWMHIGATFGYAGAWRALETRGLGEAVERIGAVLTGVAEGTDVLCVAGTEPGVYAGGALKTEARSSGDGWVVDGTKTFATLSPLATLLNTSCRVVREGQPDVVGSALIPRDTPGVEILDNWDGMGMRGSGSGVVRFTDVQLPRDALSLGRPFGSESSDFYFNGLVANAGLVNAALGIAQAARDRSLRELQSRVKLPAAHPAAERVAIQIAVAEMDVELMAAKAMQQAHLMEVNRIFAEYTPRNAPLDLMRRFTAASRASKTFAESAAISVVNQAMSLAGGGSFVTGSDYSRWYRDVRALPFMAPAQTENMQFIGKVALGLEPTIDY